MIAADRLPSRRFRRAAAPSAPDWRQVLALRDVRDVETYVSATLSQTGLPVSDHDRDELVRHGIESVVRIERALPPEQRLAPALDRLLPAQLAEGSRALARRGEGAPLALAG
jgi:hypothetical protein